MSSEQAARAAFFDEAYAHKWDELPESARAFWLKVGAATPAMVPALTEAEAREMIDDLLLATKAGDESDAYNVLLRALMGGRK